MAGNPASAIYGSIITASLLAAETAYDESLVDVLVLIGATLIVFWVAHAYTDVLGERVLATGDHRLLSSPRIYRHALREQWPIVESGLLPIVVVLIASAFGAHLKTALTIALIVDVVELFGWGALAARRMRLPAGRAVVYAALTGLLGVVLVVLKTLLH